MREERAKIPCKRFKNYQECSFGDNCNYSHYSEAELRNFESIIHQEELEKAKVPKLLTLQDWLEKRSSSESLSSSTAKILQTEPSRIYNYRLPPSLIPATKEQIMSCKLEQWGWNLKFYHYIVFINHYWLCDIKETLNTTHNHDTYAQKTHTLRPEDDLNKDQNVGKIKKVFF